MVDLPLWKMMEFVSWDDDIPNIWKVIKFHGSKPPTRLYKYPIFTIIKPLFIQYWHILTRISHDKPKNRVMVNPISTNQLVGLSTVCTVPVFLWITLDNHSSRAGLHSPQPWCRWSPWLYPYRCLIQSQTRRKTGTWKIRYCRGYHVGPVVSVGL